MQRLDYADLGSLYLLNLEDGQLLKFMGNVQAGSGYYGNYYPDSTSIYWLPANFAAATSPNKLYRAENYGIDTNITSGGKNPTEGIRLVEAFSGKVLWNMTPGYYDCIFSWSSDSRYLSVSYTARTEGYTIIVNTEDFSEISVPLPVGIQEKLRDYRPDIYIKSREWLQDSRLSISFQWIGKDDKTYSGTYFFNPITGEISHVQMGDGIVPG